MDSEPRIMVAGGGTGGHLYPAIALVKEIEQRFPNSKFLFIGTRRGIEARVVPELEYDIRFIWLRGVQRRLNWRLLIAPIQLLVSIVQCIYTLATFKPHVVIGTGGYVSGPALMLAALFRFPTIIQEQNSFPGMTTRMLARLVDQVHVTFESSIKYFNDQDKVFLSGNPVRGHLSDVPRDVAAQKFGLKASAKTLLIFGGSQGAQSVNQAMVRILPQALEQKEWQVLWGTGELSYAEVSMKMQPFADRVKVLPYIADMAAAYGIADLVVARAGATTVAELQTCGLPAILIPYPFAAANHQEANARALVEANAARMILDNELDSDKLLIELKTLMDNETARIQIGEHLKALALPDAAKTIIDKMMTLLDYD
ncbi:undecaprenyldiphospho-muramoylpentapeptide beta-N-acetylglucosaminyltransferase [candidate division KSB1 bacterium]|nr:undecaprenyldiphospho-muramoylpentapeptide beta-N-acetylglucosaminyltransferase [candidate division KSB1 bacterium]